MQTTSVASLLARPVAHRPRAAEVAAVAPTWCQGQDRRAPVSTTAARANCARGNSDAFALVDSRILGWPGSRPLHPPLVTDASPSASRRTHEFPVAERRAELQTDDHRAAQADVQGSGLKVAKKGDLIDGLLEHEFGTTDDEADVDPTADIVGLGTATLEWRVVSPTSGLSFGDLDALEKRALVSISREGGRARRGRGVLRAELRGRIPRRLRRQRSNRGVLRAPPRGSWAGRAPSTTSGGAGWDDSRSSSGGDGWDRDGREDEETPQTRDASSPNRGRRGTKGGGGQEGGEDRAREAG